MALCLTYNNNNLSERENVVLELLLQPKRSSS